MSLKLIVLLMMAMLINGNVASIDTEEQPIETVTTPAQVFKYKLNVEFAISLSDSTRYASLVGDFLAATSAWEERIPIKVNMYFDEEKSVWFNEIDHSLLNRNGVIKVIFADLQAKPYNMDRYVIGLWMSKKRAIVFDREYLARRPNQMYSVALHELGHLFGVPHIINESDTGRTGILTVLPPEEADGYVMYPQVTHKPQNVLSDIEIQIATQHVQYTLALFELISKEDCAIRVDDESL